MIIRRKKSAPAPISLRWWSALLLSLFLHHHPPPLPYAHAIVFQESSQCSADNPEIYYEYATSLNGTWIGAQQSWELSAQLVASPKRYAIEATRYLNNNLDVCAVCPYHADQTPSTQWDILTKYPYMASPLFLSEEMLSMQMYGPCFNNEASLPMKCLQHPVLKPFDLLGEYYYPRQDGSILYKYFSPLYSLPNPIIRITHLLLTDDNSTKMNTNTSAASALRATTYGLGKETIKQRINGMKILNKTTGDILQVETAKLKEFFVDRLSKDGSTIVERWPIYAQINCMAGCHRDARYTYASYATANKLLLETGGATGKYSYVTPGTSHVKCQQCPPASATFPFYDGSSGYASFELATAPFIQSYCIPWFGAVPKYDLAGEFLKSQKSSMHGDYLETFKEYELELCDVNTYNRECGLTKQQYKKLSLDPDIPQEVFQYGAKSQCTPCPSGFHTAGQRGAWFCLPPLGNLFERVETRTVLQEDATQNAKTQAAGTIHEGVLYTSIVNRNQWRRRNLWAFELECGTEPYECQQCAKYDICQDCTPSEFNERLIFERFFATRNCTAGYYCPDAVTETKCPTEKPYSPPGSFSLSNCTCGKGNFLNTTSRTCVPCTASCSRGFYVQASQCLKKDAATQDAPCTPCENINAQTMDVQDGAYEDTANGRVIPGHGVCSFTCKPAHQLTSALYSSGLTRYTCTKIQPITNGSAVVVFFPILEDMLFRDALKVVSNSYTIATRKLTDTINNWYNFKATPDPSSPALPDLMSCASPGTYLSDYTGYSQRVCTNCSRRDLPSNAVFDRTIISSGSSSSGSPPGGADSPLFSIAACAAIRCLQSQTFFNYSSWSCSSCAQAASSPLLSCPANTYLRGQGCLGNFSNFSYAPAIDCVQCNKSIAEVPPNSYLALADCTLRACPVIPENSYPAVPCQETSPGSSAPCKTASQECGPKGFLEFVDSNNPAAGCNTRHNWPCKPCTEGVAGKYKLQDCNLYHDTTFAYCPSNYYCPFNTTAPIPCPGSMLTAGLGASSQDECFCPLGYNKNAQKDGCLPLTCPNTNKDDASPFAFKEYALHSKWYMEFDNFHDSQCYPCAAASDTQTNLSFAKGSTFHFDACTCPQGYYGKRSSSSAAAAAQQSLACFQCSPTTATPFAKCTTPFTGPPESGCSGSFVVEASSALQPSTSCKLARLPFTSSPLTANGNFQCMSSEFFKRENLGVDNANIYLEKPTGSSVYIEPTPDEQTWLQLVRQENGRCLAQNDDSTTTSNGFLQMYPFLATTQEISTLLNTVEKLEFAFWPFTTDNKQSIQIAATCINCPPDASTTTTTTKCIVSTTSAPTIENPTHVWSITPLYAASSADVVLEVTSFTAGTWYTKTEDTSEAVIAATFSLTTQETQNAASSTYHELHLRKMFRDSTANFADGASFSSQNSQTREGARLDITGLKAGLSNFSIVDAAYTLSDDLITNNNNNNRPHLLYLFYQGRRASDGKRLCYIQTATIASTFESSTFAMQNNKLELCYANGAKRGLKKAATLENNAKFALVFEGEESKVYQLNIEYNALIPIKQKKLTTQTTPAAPETTALNTLSMFRFKTSDASIDITNLLTLADGAPCVPLNDPNYGNGGYSSRRCIVAADLYQNILVPIQHMPWNTHPQAIAAATTQLRVATSASGGTRLGRGLLVAMANSTIYAIRFSQCLGVTRMQQDALTIEFPHYFNGDRCVAHHCRNSANCDQNEEKTGTTCICKPAYYKDSEEDACQLCLENYYCPGKSLGKKVCQSPLTSGTGSLSELQCICRTSGTYSSKSATAPSLSSQQQQSTAATTCNACEIGYFCPNRYDRFPLPMRHRSEASSAVAPSSYSCLPGFFGPGCRPCPANKVCNSLTKSRNQAVVLKVSRTPAQNETSFFNEAALHSEIRSVLLAYFLSTPQTVSLIPNLHQKDTLEQYTHLQRLIYTRQTHADLEHLSITVQIPDDDSIASITQPSLNWEQTGWINALLQYNFASSPLSGISALQTVSEDSVFVSTGSLLANAPTDCSTASNQAPNSDSSECVCRAGAYMSKQTPLTCSLCSVNTFLMTPNKLYLCNACPAGTSTKGLTGSSNCTAIAPGDSSGSGKDSGGSLTMYIAIGGGVGGAVILVLCCIITLQCCKKKNSAANAQGRRGAKYQRIV